MEQVQPVVQGEEPVPITVRCILAIVMVAHLLECGQALVAECFVLPVWPCASLDELCLTNLLKVEVGQ